MRKRKTNKKKERNPEERLIFANIRKKVAPVKKTSLRKRTKKYMEQLKIRNLPLNMIADIDDLVENHI